MKNLGVLYANGDSVKRDNLVAYAWIGAALEAGLKGEDREVAIQELDTLAEELGSKELASARKLINEFYAVIVERQQSRKTRTDSAPAKLSFL